MKIFKWHLDPCATLFHLTRMKTDPETSQVLGAEARVVLREATVVKIIVAEVADTVVEEKI